MAPSIRISILASFLVLALSCSSISNTGIAETESVQLYDQNTGCFELAANGESVPLFISENDDAGVIRAMKDLQSDIQKVIRSSPELHTSAFPTAPKAVITGTLGQSEIIDQLAAEGKIDISQLEGAWDAYLHQVVENPVEGIEQALVIAGSDKRGTIFGIYEISKQIGVSPWYYWADVPIQQKENLYVVPECAIFDAPVVQYRGIFLNDENPALLGWVNETYGGFNHNFYEDVFELILRLKGNYLWPAMWGKAFYDDDPQNAVSADLYGVVIGTSHHEPLGRAHVEWDRYGEGDWNYQTNEEVLKNFWTEGIERIGEFEATISLGMRGDGDEPMSDDANIELLERIVDDQREILENHAENPENKLQLWALYKEVQEYYERGMRVPDDVMLLLADDNWGNVRMLPEPDKADDHPGGWGVYYHFDYVGGPRNYKWINTSQISRVWEQMNLSYQHGVERMWLVNVGDLKPMEYPISFFLDHAWNPEEMTIGKMEEYPEKWAEQQFGEEFAFEIGNLLETYTTYNARRKPELLSPETYSLIHFREAERIVDDYNNLTAKAEAIYEEISEEYKDAFYQLVLYPVKASATINELYFAAAKNRMYAEQGRSITNQMADEVQRLFDLDAELTNEFHTDLADGKWNHMMSQTRIGYTYWQQPEQNNMPEVQQIEIPENAEMGIMAEGSQNWWPHSDELTLPVFDKFNQQEYFIEIFNRGVNPLIYTIESDTSWLELSPANGEIAFQDSIFVSINWDEVPSGNHQTEIKIKGSDNAAALVHAEIFNPQNPDISEINGFVEANGFVSMEAAHFKSKIDGNSIQWKEIPRLGKTLSGMTVFPVTAGSNSEFSENTPRLEYNMHLFSSGDVSVHVYAAPTLNYNLSDGLKYGISFNDEEPQIVNIHENMNWDQVVADYINILQSTHRIDEPGEQTLKIWMVDPGVVIEKIVVETGEVGKTYLGPPESFRTE